MSRGLEGRRALVTGGGGGIGAALGAELARRGASVALADIDAGRAEAAAAAIPGAHALVADVADPAAAEALPTLAAEALGGLDLLVNNAGIAAGGTFEQMAAADFDRVLAVNLHAPVRLARAALPLLRASGRGWIVNISSLFGLIAPAGQTAYAAAKFGLRGFSDALRHELAEEGAPVGVTTVHPGGVRTRIARDAIRPTGAGPTDAEIAAFEKNLKMPPEDAARIILDAVAKGRGRVLVGGDAKLLALIERLAPAGYWSVISRLMG